MKKGFTLVEIMIVVAIIGLLAAIAIPSFMKARTTSQQNACINNLRQVEAGKDQYALEMGLTNGAFVAGAAQSDANDITAFSNLVGRTVGYLKHNPYCPASTNMGTNAVCTATISSLDYDVNSIGTDASCENVGATHFLK